ncbi:hypothetical protein GHT89_16465 [Acinetobacter baumannii]|uniref:hypothetical protein n=1 Tax=Acinetobacter baumannii TaxID=470 RepID=UPI00387DC18E
MNIKHSDDFYVKPEPQTQSSKKIDQYLGYCLIGYVIATIFLVLDAAFFKFGIGEKIIGGSKFFIWGGIALIIYGIGHFNGTLTRRKVPDNLVYDLITDIKTKKVNSNILAFMKINGGISLRDLRLILSRMNYELDDYYQEGFKEMVAINDQLPAEKQRMIDDLKHDIAVMRAYLYPRNGR